MKNVYKILVIDDEAQIRRLLRAALEGHDYAVSEAGTVGEGVMQVAMENPDALILDLGLPDGDGIQVVQKVREWSQMPIIILSAKSEEGQKVAALDAGADDYVTKPFGTAELLARVRTALRHAAPVAASAVFVNGDLSVDLSARVVRLAGTEVSLTGTEYNLLVLFVRNAGKVLTQNYILREVWGRAFSDQAQYLRVYVRQLRRKLERVPSHPEIFITETGVGYRMRVEGDF